MVTRYNVSAVLHDGGSLLLVVVRQHRARSGESPASGLASAARRVALAARAQVPLEKTTLTI